MPQPGEILPAGTREVRVDRMWHLVQGQPLHDTRYAEAVIAVEMGEADPGDVGGAHPRQQHLALRPLTGVEQQTFAVPAQQVAVL